MKKMKLKFILPILIITLLIVDVIASFYFYNIAVARTSKEFLSASDDLEHYGTIPVVNPINTWFNEQGFKDVSIESEDGLDLHGYYLEAEEITTKTAIIVHGYSGKSKDMASYAKFYHETLGYNVLMPDNRGHGLSEGDYIGFGWIDRGDYLGWIDYILKTVGEEAEIILHGVSMGGATVLMTSGEDLPTNVKAIVSDCAYTSVKAELSYQLKRMYNLPSFPIIESTSLLTKLKAGYFFSEASALDQVAKSNTPTLFIHGDADTFVPFEMVYELYENCSSEKDILIVQGAEHGTAYRSNKIGYETKVTDFINKYVSN
jgi:hypothetical protein